MGYGHGGAALFCLDISQQKARNTAPVHRCFLMHFSPPKKSNMAFARMTELFFDGCVSRLGAAKLTK